MQQYKLDETFLWSHEPFLSSAPVQLVCRKLHIGEKREVDEAAVFLLENNKFLYIRFYGLVDSLNLGITDLEEFESKEDALNLYRSVTGEINVKEVNITNV